MAKACYVCEACGFAYHEEELARKCETWCKKHNSCNIEITKNSIGEVKLHRA